MSGSLVILVTSKSIQNNTTAMDNLNLKGSTFFIHPVQGV